MNQQPHEDTPQELVRLGCVLLRILISWATSATVARIGNRIDLLSQSVSLPESGYGDVRAVAARFNVTVPGARKLIDRLNLPSYQPGAAVLYHLADLAQQPEGKGGDE